MLLSASAVSLRKYPNETQTGGGRNPRPRTYFKVFIMNDRVVFEIAQAQENFGAQYQSFGKHRYDQKVLDTLMDWTPQ